jgi:hypothetical protein
MLVVLAVFSAVSFYAYGVGCLLAAHMVVEFNRYGLAKFRALTGILQLLGAVGLTIGVLGVPVIGFLAAIGLSLQMALGVGVRIKIRDSLLQCMPAFFYFCLNAWIAYLFTDVL